MIEQLSLFGASNTQQHYSSETWGLVEFFPHKEDNRCRKCLLCRSEEDCRNAPCSSNERNDKLDGYYTIHQMPS